MTCSGVHRLLRLSLVPRDGARVVRGRGDRRVTERTFRKHQGRPGRAAGRRPDLYELVHRVDRARRLADDVLLDHDGNPLFGGTYFRTGIGTGSRVHAGPCWRRARPVATRRRRAARRRATCGSISNRGRRGLGPPDLDVSTGASRCSPRDSTGTGGFGGAPKFPPAMSLEFLRQHHVRRGALVVTRRARRWRAAGSTTSSAAASPLLGGRGMAGPALQKMLYDNAQLLGLYARLGRASWASAWHARQRTS